MMQENILDYAALREWQAEIIAYKKSDNGYILQTSHGKRRLFICESEKQAKTARLICEHLVMHGFTAIPRPIKNRFGEFIVPAFNGYYYLTDDFGDASLAFDNEEKCIETAAFLGAFHKASKGFHAEKMSSVSFAGQKIAKRLLQLQCLTCLDELLSQDFSYLLQSTSAALAGFNPQKEAKLQKVYRRRGGFNLGGQLKFLTTENENIFISDISECRAGGGICDLSELLLQTAGMENYAGNTALKALKAYNRENRLEREELDLLLAALLLPALPLGIINRYLRGDFEQTVFLQKFSAVCEEERQKNRWVKRLLL